MPQASPLSAPAPSGARLGLRWRTELLIAFVASLAAVAFAALPLDRAVIAAFLAGVLAVVSVIDIEQGIIPNRIVLPASALVLVAQIAVFPDRALEWTLAPMLLALLLAVPSLFGRAWMGMGDVKLGLLLGAGLGWGAFSAFLAASVCAFPAALIVLVRGGMAARKTMIPFGPFLSLGALIVLLGPSLAGLPTS